MNNKEKQNTAIQTAIIELQDYYSGSDPLMDALKNMPNPLQVDADTRDSFTWSAATGDVEYAFISHEDGSLLIVGDSIVTLPDGATIALPALSVVRRVEK
jgi:hypothetical protein